MHKRSIRRMKMKTLI